VNKARSVAARSRQAFNETGAVWIRDVVEDYWHGGRRLQNRRHTRIAGYDHHVGRLGEQAFCMPANLGRITASPADVDLHVTAFGPA
jgi:hypothetical protein